MSFHIRSASVKVLTTSLATAVLLPSQGCIVRDIRDEMVAANVNMDETQEMMMTINARLIEIETDIEEVRTTNESLEDVKARLEMLESIDESLRHLDAHLASLRRTIENIDSTIPFLKISDPAADEDATEESPEDDAGEEG